MLDPTIAGLMQAMAAQGFALPEPLEAGSLRAMLDVPMPAPPVEGVAARDLRVPGGAGDIPARLYTPSEGILPLLVYFHGGGWVHGTIDTHDRLARALARDVGCAVLSVGYRLAPEHRFPAAYDDALAVTRWAIAQAQSLGADGARVAVAGDSAGGNLAAGVAVALATTGDALVHQLLFYPVVDGRCASPSYRTDVPGFLSASQMRWYWDQYAPGDARMDPRASPLLGDLPAPGTPATIILASNDPLHDEGLAYAEALKGGGTPVMLRDDAGAIHGYINLFGMVPLADEALAAATQALKTAFRA